MRFFIALVLLAPIVSADEPPVGIIGAKDEGTKLTRRRFINFTGDGVSAADDSGTPETDITISGGASATAPSVPLTDTTTGHDDFEWWADNSVVGLSNTTDGQQLQIFDPEGVLILPTYAGDCAGGKVLTVLVGGHVACTAVSGAGTPGGSDTQVQFNSSGSFAGDAGFTYVSGTDTATLGTLSLTNALTVANGGTGATSLTDGGILLGSGTGAITALGVAANGQIPIGDGTTDPVLAEITGTASEITVTPGAGSITLDIPDNPDFDGDPTISDTSPSLCLNPASGTDLCLHLDPGAAVGWVGQGSTHFERWLSGGRIQWPGLLSCDVKTDPTGTAYCGTDAGAGSGDITDVYNCASGDCNNIAATDGDLLNFSAVNSSGTSEGMILPQGTAPTGGTAEGQIAWETDVDLLHIGDGATAQNILSWGILEQSAVNATTTFYMGCTDSSTTESAVSTCHNAIARNCGFLRARTATAPGVGNSWIATVQNDDAASIITCTISGATASCDDITNIESFAADNRVHLEMLETGTATGTTRESWSLVCWAD